MVSGHPPFPIEHSLHHNQLLPTRTVANCALAHSIPENSNDTLAHVPGEPTIALNAFEINTYLSEELSTPGLDEMHRWLWCLAKKDGTHIDPLHRQLVKRRKIVVSEEMRLHLVWDSERIFLKPIPLCLLSHQFWLDYLDTMGSTGSPSAAHDLKRSKDRENAMGFLRTYAFLIRHRSDFAVAQGHGLLPEIHTWEKWALFLQHFRVICDTEVGKRYEYGQLRLSRLNWAVRILHPGGINSSWFYEFTYWSTLPYLQSVSIPLLFAFAGFSLVLSAMQVILAASTPDYAPISREGVNLTTKVFWNFSLAVIVANIVVWLLLSIVPSVVLLAQLIWGFRHRGGFK